MSDNQFHFQTDNKKVSRRNEALINFTLGQLDYWLGTTMYEESEKVQPLNPSNYSKIKIEEYVYLSGDLWHSYCVLLSLMDKSSKQIIRGTKKDLCKNFFSMNERNFQKHLNALYEIYLIDFKEKKYKNFNMIDIFVHDVPPYADSKSCKLKKVREGGFL